jgi:hypothetical protein
MCSMTKEKNIVDIIHLEESGIYRKQKSAKIESMHHTQSEQDVSAQTAL